jgi:LPXTG-motif cell wall-anchored protein
LAVTGSNPLLLALAGLALLVVGRVLLRAARRRQHFEADEGVSVG